MWAGEVKPCPQGRHHAAPNCSVLGISPQLCLIPGLPASKARNGLQLSLRAPTL